jgi:hypothetical protein
MNLGFTILSMSYAYRSRAAEKFETVASIVLNEEALPLTT